MVRKKDFLRKQSIDNYNENNDEFSVCVNLAIVFVHVNLTIFFNFEFMEISHLSTGGRAPGDFCFPMPDVRIFTVIFFNSKILRMCFCNFWKYFRSIMIQRWSKPQYKAHKH